MPGYETATWYGLFAPAGTPAPIVERLNREIGRIIRSDAFTKRLIDFGIEAAHLDPDRVRRGDQDRTSRAGATIVVASGAKVD
ncbi:MAG: tripartite tricarboxylate transporter substrate-binding protein [Pseudomonadota bacterium]